jgi:predicted nucleotidyltransferase
MLDIQTLQKEIVERLKPLEPDQIVLFGSYAQGMSTESSDIDLYVVTHDDFFPESWEEKNRIYLTVSRKIRDLRSQVPIDLIVHTKKMHEKFVQLGGFFSREICQKGIRLL